MNASQSKKGVQAKAVAAKRLFLLASKPLSPAVHCALTSPLERGALQTTGFRQARD
jgi:hypothetical protein